MAQNIQAINVGINAQGAQQGARQVNAALGSIQKQIMQLAHAIGQMNAAAGRGARGGGGGPGGPGGPVGAAGAAVGGQNIPQATSQLAGFMQILNRIRNTLFVVYLIRQAFDGVTTAIKAAIGEGLRFNAVMEQAVIGTGGLIAQIAILERRGVKLEGVEAIAAGMNLAKREVLALQIAGLQTAATSEALVNAFQQAVGPGLAAGLALKQVRDLTVDIVQVATAIGLPMHQIAQEVRAIVEGTIDPNARVAKVLQIRNADIEKMKAAGTLADFLFKKLDKFREIGPIIEKSFAGAISNVVELSQVLSGLVTGPLFEHLRDSLVKATEGLRATGLGKNARELSDVFSVDIQEDIKAFGEIFEEVGQQVDRIITVIVDRVRDMLTAFSGTPDAVNDTKAAVESLGDAIVIMIESIDTDTLVKFAATLRDLAAKASALASIYLFLNRVYSAFGAIINYVALAAGKYFLVITQLIRVLTLQVSAEKAQQEFWAGQIKLTQSMEEQVTNLKEAWQGTPVNQIENEYERISLALGSTDRMVKDLMADILDLNGAWGTFGSQWQSFFEKAAPTAKEVQKKLGRGSNIFDVADVMEGRKTIEEAQYGVQVRFPKYEAPPNKGAADKARRAAEQAAAKERAFQLSKLQLIEQTSRDAADLEDEYRRIRLKQNEEAFEREIKNLKEYEDERRKIQMEGAQAEVDLARLRAVQTLAAGQKALGQLAPEADIISTADIAGLQSLLKELESNRATVATQEQAEALRELIQAIYGLIKARLAFKVASGDFELDKLPVIKRRQEPVPLAISEVSAQYVAFENMRKEREKIQALEQEALNIQKALTLGYITQAEALERQADNEERVNELAIARLTSEINVLDTILDADKIHDKTLEKMERLSRVFRVSNAAAFFKGLNENLEKLSDKFQRLGEDLRSTFREAFEELGRTGIRGFADTFLQGIADMLNTRAADALSQIMGKIFTDIFKSSGGQSIFDKMLEQLLRIFGRAPTGKLSIGGIFEKIFGKLLDPLGRKKPGDLPIQGAPKGLPEILGEMARQTPEERTQGILGVMSTEVSGIHRETMDMAQSLRELKQCCHEHNDLLKQQMAAASKGPGLLGTLLGAAVGAATGGFIGGISFGGGAERTGVTVAGEGELPIYPSPWAPGEPLPGGGMIPPGYLPPSPSGPIRYNDPFSNLAAVTTNITIQTPNPAAFNAPQTQAQIGSLVYSNIQKAQNLVPAITNPNAFNK